MSATRQTKQHQDSRDDERIPWSLHAIVAAPRSAVAEPQAGSMRKTWDTVDSTHGKLK